MPYKDKKKQAAAQKRWYEKNKERHYKNTRAIKKAQVEKMTLFANEYKASQGCCRCPENDPVCLDFHHEGDDKVENVSRLIKNGWSQTSIQKEIDKCIVICSNCHRKLHAGEAY